MNPSASDTIRDLLAVAQRELDRIETARLDAELLLACAAGRDRAWFHAHPEQTLSDAICADFRRLVSRRAEEYPLAYLTGEREFWSLSFQVNRHTLIPRPETEQLVETALEFMRPHVSERVLDLGTGSGAIAIAVAHERRDSSVTATDVSREALAAARDNAARLGAPEIRFMESDWYSGLQLEMFDLILCNPPYVESDDPLLTDSGLRHEPRLALDGGHLGLRALGIVVAGAMPHLAGNGSLIVEHGEQQGEPVRRMMEMNGFLQIHTLRDAAGLERITRGVRP